MITRKSECRKFSANIFDKRKCSNCFRQKEEHNADALNKFNQMSRKILKCGYLFVAPDWDFTNPIYRSKRWQRRWFILFDDGELTYAVDDHVDTVPQGIVNVPKALDICMADAITGNPFSICITESDKRTFVKATFPEEIKWWLKELDAFMTQTKRDNKFFKKSLVTDVIESQDQVDFPSCTSDSRSDIENENFTNNLEKRSFTTRSLRATKRSLTLPVTTNLPQQYSSLPSYDHDDEPMMPSNAKLMNIQSPHERGDPDGDCGVDKITSNCMTRNSEYEVTHDDVPNVNKGWLYKKDPYGMWFKYWFSQTGPALFYYRDAIAEERGIMDGVLDLNNIIQVKVDSKVDNMYSFIISTWDNKKIVLAALTENTRTYWIKVINKASGKETCNYNSSSNNNKPSIQHQQEVSIQPVSEPVSITPKDISVPHQYSSLQDYSNSNNNKNEYNNNNNSSNTNNNNNNHTNNIKNKTTLNRMGSLSDLAELPDFNPYQTERHILAQEYNELKFRFQKIIDELRILKKELRNAHYMYDTLEIKHKAQKTEFERLRSEQQARVAMMAERIEDLTNKYTAAEKNTRNLKIKLSRVERRRSLSLKGREFSSSSHKESVVAADQMPTTEIFVFGENNQIVENKLKIKLHELLNERKMLMESNDLSPCKRRELLVKRLAYESVCFEKLKAKIQPKRSNFTKDVSLVSEIESKIYELCCVMNNNQSMPLHSKTDSNNSTNTSSSSNMKLSLFEMLYLVSQQKKNELCAIEKMSAIKKGLVATIEKYKQQTLEKFLYTLASDATNSFENILQNVINEISVNALRKTNEDLIQYEIDHMLSLLDRTCDTLLMSSLPITMFCIDMYYFEIFADQIHKCLKDELSEWNLELKDYFTNVLLKVKDGQWNNYSVNEQNPNDTITDLSKVIALKAIIDGQILFMTLDHSSEVPNSNDKNTFFVFLDEVKHQYLIYDKFFVETSSDVEESSSKMVTDETYHDSDGVDVTAMNVLKKYDSKLVQVPDACSKDHLCGNPDKSLQQRYCEEIEQLRKLCQRGMDALRASHQAVILEMEENHKIQIKKLEIEKEQALAEETKATLAALDAMQKAHKSEVQREILRFKDEFIKQSQQNVALSPNSYQKKTELETIQKEVWSLSEKYTNKCLEVASLEEKLQIAHDKLKDCETRLEKARNRNQRLRNSYAGTESCLLLKDSPSKSKTIQIFQKTIPDKDTEVERPSCIESSSGEVVERFKSIELNI